MKALLLWIVKKEWLVSYPTIPQNLKYLYENMGYGSIGNGRYMIHALIEPDEIYDQETAEELERHSYCRR